ncbi:hypothetical protein [Aminobacterium mobile]
MEIINHGIDTVSFALTYFPISTSKKFYDSKQTRRREVVHGVRWQAEAFSFYGRSYWCFTIHSPTPHQLMNAIELWKRIQSVLDSLNTPSWIAETHSIRFTRVDYARDYAGKPTVENDERAEMKRRRMVERKTKWGTTYWANKSCVITLYNKARQLREVYGLHIKDKIWRKEVRWKGGASCKRACVRTFKEVEHLLKEMGKAIHGKKRQAVGLTLRRAPALYSNIELRNKTSVEALIPFPTGQARVAPRGNPVRNWLHKAQGFVWSFLRSLRRRFQKWVSPPS